VPPWNPSSSALKRLARDGFKSLVCLLDEDEQAARYDAATARDCGFVTHRIPVKDWHPLTINQLNQFVKLVGACHEDRAVVHCEGGTGRTGTFGAAYWVARGMSALDAIARIRRVRPGAVETSEQEGVVATFAAINFLGDHLGLV
jgi:protein-tyrosine phosphatase